MTLNLPRFNNFNSRTLQKMIERITPDAQA
jgi:hypothetical protein